MEANERAAYIQAQAASAMIEALAMVFGNIEAGEKDKPLPYGEAQFRALVDKYGIGHNAVISYLQR